MNEIRRIPDIWRRLDVTLRDLPLALLLAVGSFVPMLNAYATQLGDLPARPHDALVVLVIAGESLPLIVRRKWPAVCLTLVSLAFIVDQLRVYHAFAASGLTIALLSAGAHLDRHRRVAVVLLTVAYVPVAITLDGYGSTEGLSGFLLFYVLAAVAWRAGAWLRSTRATEAERRRLVAETTRAAERTRIAGELHDVVTHHVTAMVVQAEAARYLTAAPARLDEALRTITGTGRMAISDLRNLLDVLDPGRGGEPGAPSSGGLHTLVEQTRRAGQPVEFTEEGRSARPSGGAERAVHRVVQEALTNALKHAHGSRTVVQVHYGEREIAVEVGTDGSGARTVAPAGGGRGLAGLRERVGALGGEFSADPRANGGYLVRARIPAGTPS